MYKVYALASINRKYVYVGFTSDLDQRIKRHNGKLEKTTKPYAPFQLVYTEEIKERPFAREREKYLKGRTGKRYLYKVIQNEFPSLIQY